eukprot:Hpha_TRINITY_DN29765_c0_g1::TRINITY_DN29765_c0_g1_i1::g.2656::m.2656
MGSENVQQWEQQRRRLLGAVVMLLAGAGLLALLVVVSTAVEGGQRTPESAASESRAVPRGVSIRLPEPKPRGADPPGGPKARKKKLTEADLKPFNASAKPVSHPRERCGGIPCAPAGNRFAVPYKMPQLAKIILQRLKQWRPEGPFKPLFGGPHKRNANAVFALAKGYPLNRHQVFCGSLRTLGGFKGDIVLSVDDKLTKESKRYLRGEGVIAYPMWQCRNGSKIRDTGYLKTSLQSGSLCSLNFNAALSRHFMYREWLRHYSDSSLILFTDYRDVFFQADPFQGLLNDEHLKGSLMQMWLFKEHWPTKKIGGCPINQRWIADCWGRDLVNVLADETVVCSGSTMGFRKALVIFEERLWKEVAARHTCTALRHVGMDQPLYNVLYHANILGKLGLDVIAFPRGYGPVNTVGAFYPGSREGYAGPFKHVLGNMRDKDGFILNCPQSIVPEALMCYPSRFSTPHGVVRSCVKDGDSVHFFHGCNDSRVSPVVHQWDRFQPELNSFVDRRIRCKNATGCSPSRNPRKVVRLSRKKKQAAEEAPNAEGGLQVV